MKVININSPKSYLLRQKTTDIQENEFPLAQEIADQLLAALEPYFPAAGLAAPQIGLDRSIFIVSFDRDPKNLEAVINPTFSPLNEEKEHVWEGCISCMTDEGVFKIAKVFRYKTIRVSYFNIKGEKIEKTLEGFAAKAFQHETDHLRGIINIEREGALVKSFETEESFRAFMTLIKKRDADSYKKPQ